MKKVKFAQSFNCPDREHTSGAQACETYYAKGGGGGGGGSPYNALYGRLRSKRRIFFRL